MGHNSHYTLQRDQVKESRWSLLSQEPQDFMVHFLLMASLKFKPRGQCFPEQYELRGQEGAGRMWEVLAKGGAVSSLLQGSAHCLLNQ